MLAAHSIFECECLRENMSVAESERIHVSDIMTLARLYATHRCGKPAKFYL